MALADSPLAALLKNVATDLANVAQFPDLKELHQFRDDPLKAIAVTFGPLIGKAPPYAIVIPGPAVSLGDSARQDNQVVEIHLVHGIISDPDDLFTLIGTPQATGLISLLDAVETSLLRPGAPYQTTVHSFVTVANGYTNQNEVRAVWKEGWAAPERVDLPEFDDTFVVQVLTLTYPIVKGQL